MINVKFDISICTSTFADGLFQSGDKLLISFTTTYVIKFNVCWLMRIVFMVDLQSSMIQYLFFPSSEIGLIRVTCHKQIETKHYVSDDWYFLHQIHLIWVLYWFSIYTQSWNISFLDTIQISLNLCMWHYPSKIIT